MIIFNGGRGQGKTMTLVKISAEKQIPIVAFNSRHIEHIKQTAKRMKLNIPDPILFEYVKEKTRGNHKELLIDDLDYILKRIFDNDIYAVSMTDAYVCKLKEKI